MLGSSSPLNRPTPISPLTRCPIYLTLSILELRFRSKFFTAVPSVGFYDAISRRRGRDPEGPEDLIGIRLRANTRVRRNGAAQSADIVEHACAQESCVHRTWRDRETHLAQAYGRECCLGGCKTYYLKATELRDRLRRAAGSDGRSRIVATLVNPSCLIADEVERCTFDRACTNLFFDGANRC